MRSTASSHSRSKEQGAQSKRAAAVETAGARPHATGDQLAVSRAKPLLRNATNMKERTPRTVKPESRVQEPKKPTPNTLEGVRGRAGERLPRWQKRPHGQNSADHALRSLRSEVDPPSTESNALGFTRTP